MPVATLCVSDRGISRVGLTLFVILCTLFVVAVVPRQASGTEYPAQLFGYVFEGQDGLVYLHQEGETCWGFVHAGAGRVGVFEVKGTSVVDLFQDGGLQPILVEAGGLLAWVAQNGGLQFTFQFQYGLAGFLDLSGGLFGVLHSDGNQLLFVDSDNGDTQTVIRADGGMLGLDDEQSTLRATIYAAGGMLDLTVDKGGFVGVIQPGGGIGLP